jgi:hypothetical protein
MTKRNPRVRLFVRAAALAAVVTCVAACSSDTSTSSSLQDTLAPVSSTTVGSTLDPNATTTVVTTAVTIDANGALQGGLAALANGYHFVSTVTVNGTPSLTAEGDRIGDSSSLVLSGEGGTVSYIVTPGGSYAQPEGGDWSLLDVAPATADPIAALLAPVSVVAIPTTDGSVAVQATVTAVALGISAEGNVDVQVVLVNGAISQITYSTAVEGGTAQVVSTITPLVDATPIVAPI